MRTIRALIGLPAIVGSRKVGKVIQAEMSDDLTYLTGLWIHAGFSGTRFIPAESISVIGRQVLLADEPGMRKRRRKSTLFRRAIGTDGARLGAVTGGMIDELSFRVEVLEISSGLWDDLLYGRSYTRCFKLNQATGDVIVDIAEIKKEVE